MQTLKSTRQHNLLTNCSHLLNDGCQVSVFPSEKTVYLEYRGQYFIPNTEQTKSAL